MTTVLKIQAKLALAKKDSAEMEQLALIAKNEEAQLEKELSQVYANAREEINAILKSKGIDISELIPTTVTKKVPVLSLVKTIERRTSKPKRTNFDFIDAFAVGEYKYISQLQGGNGKAANAATNRNRKNPGIRITTKTMDSGMIRVKRVA